MLHLDKQKIRNPEFWNYWKVRPSSLHVLERGGPGPIGSRKRGPRVNFKGGGPGLFINMNLLCFVFEAKRFMSTIPLNRISL